MRKKKHECDGEGCGLCFEDGCSDVSCLCARHKAEYEDVRDASEDFYGGEEAAKEPLTFPLGGEAASTPVPLGGEAAFTRGERDLHSRPPRQGPRVEEREDDQ